MELKTYQKNSIETLNKYLSELEKVNITNTKFLSKSDYTKINEKKRYCFLKQQKRLQQKLLQKE